MNAVDFLKQQHQEVKQLFEQFKSSTSEGEDAQGIVRQLCDNLVIHDKLEHDILYPALLKHEETKDIVLEGLEEHHLMKIVLKQLASLDATDESYKAKVTVLQEVVQHHIEEEESEMFNQAKKVLGEESLTRMGEQMQQLTEQFKAQEPQFTVTMLREVTLETTK